MVVAARRAHLKSSHAQRAEGLAAVMTLSVGAADSSNADIVLLKTPPAIWKNYDS